MFAEITFKMRFASQFQNEQPSKTITTINP